MYMPGRVFVLQTRTQKHCALYHNEQKYILGFPSKYYAAKLHKSIDTYKISGDNDSVSYGNICIKTKPYKTRYKIKELKLNDFLALRTTNGLIFGMDLVENSKELCFSSIIISKN